MNPDKNDTIVLASATSAVVSVVLVSLFTSLKSRKKTITVPVPTAPTVDPVLQAKIDVLMNLENPADRLEGLRLVYDDFAFSGFVSRLNLK